MVNERKNRKALEAKKLEPKLEAKTLEEFENSLYSTFVKWVQKQEAQIGRLMHKEEIHFAFVNFVDNVNKMDTGFEVSIAHNEGPCKFIPYDT